MLDAGMVLPYVVHRALYKPAVRQNDGARGQREVGRGAREGPDHP